MRAVRRLASRDESVVRERCERCQKSQWLTRISSSSPVYPILPACFYILVCYRPLARLLKREPRKPRPPRGREESSVVLGHVPSRPVGIANTS